MNINRKSSSESKQSSSFFSKDIELKIQRDREIIYATNILLSKQPYEYENKVMDFFLFESLSQMHTFQFPKIHVQQV